MEYRTILVDANRSAHSAQRIRVAATLARELAAHLVGVAATGISRFVRPADYLGAAGKSTDVCCEPAYAAAHRCLDEFESLARDAGTSSWERRVVDDLPEQGLARQARFCDLVVLSQDDPAESNADEVIGLPEYVVLNCARPVLIVPYAGQSCPIGSGALLGWNGSKEASSAMTGAIPLLRRASQLTAVMVDPPDHELAAGADLVAYLGRHGIPSTLQTRHADGDTGSEILDAATELQCGLLVMGCYGQARFRELALGGASRTILRSTTVPVLMAH